MNHLFHTQNVHVGLYVPWAAPAGRQIRLGIGGRVRHRGLWRQAMIYLEWPRRDLRLGRVMFLIEAKTWLATRPGGKGSGVSGSKKFIRLKVGSGYDLPSSRQRRSFEVPPAHRRRAA